MIYVLLYEMNTVLTSSTVEYFSTSRLDFPHFEETQAKKLYIL